MKRIAVATITIAALAGCGEIPPEQGEPHDEVLIPGEVTELRQALVGTQYVFVNFDGPAVTDCSGFCSDAPTNRSWAIGAHFGRSSVDFAPWGSTAQRALVVERLTAAFEPYDVRIVTQRPTTGPYQMLVVSSSNVGPAHGVAPLDCDNDNPNDIAFVYRVGSSSTGWVARAAAHELGHSFGLAHVVGTDDFMQWASSGDAFTISQWDTSHSTAKCFAGSVQNAPALLETALGSSAAPSPAPAYPSTQPGDQIALHDARTGLWHLQAGNGSTKTFYFGNPADTPFAGDWDCDGVDSLGLYRETAGYLFLRNSNSQGIADVEIYYGNPGDRPLAGDWNGDGCDTIGIHRPSEQKFYLRNDNTAGFADIEFMFGNPGDVGLAGDFDGDGISTIAIWRPSTGQLYVLDGHATANAVRHVFAAAPHERPLVGDWNGDGVDGIGFFDSTTARFRLFDELGDPSSFTSFAAGESHMTPVGGSWGL